MEAQVLEILSKSFLFEGIPIQQAAPLLEEAELVDYAKQDCIYDRTHYRQAMGILISGGAAVIKGQGVVLNQLRPGSSFGVAGLFTPRQQYVSTIVATRPTQVLYLTEQQLSRLFSALPQTAVNYIRFLSQRLCFLNQKLDAFTAPTIESRIALYLRDSAVNGSVQVADGYTALAKHLGLGRASLYRALSSLEQAGTITRQDRTIVIQDPKALSALIP